MPEPEAKAPSDNKSVRDYNDEVALRNYKRNVASERRRARKEKLLKLGKGAVSGIRKVSASYKAKQRTQVKRVAKKTSSVKLLKTKPAPLPKGFTLSGGQSKRGLSKATKLKNPFSIGKL